MRKVERGRLRLRLLGRFGVEGDLHAPLPTGKAERLLALLAAHHGRFLPVQAAIDALWADHPPDKAERNVAALISRLRSSLGRDRIQGGPGGYRLVRDNATVVDVFEAGDLVQTAEWELARGRYALAAISAEQAEQVLAAGTPLTRERDAQWADDIRRLAERELRRARACRWTAALELGEPATAVEAAEDALATDPLDEPACRALMLAHQRAGEPGAALTAYNTLRTALAEALGADPSPDSQELFLSLLRGEGPATPGQPTPDSRAPVPRLVGRDPELTELLRLWSRAAHGQPGVALLVGEAGIGKTALVSALAGEVRRTGGLAISTCCFEAERSLYLQPLIEAVREIVARHDPRILDELGRERLATLTELVPEITRTAGAVPYQRATPELEHRRSLEALTAFLGRLAERRPVMLAVEDMQNAGQSTVEALHFLATRLTGCRLLVVATERTDEHTPVVASLRDLATVIRLGPLNVAAVRELVERSGLAYDIGLLYDWTGGSPLFVTELLAHPRRPHSGDEAEPEIPGSLHEAVADRLANVGEEVSLLLQQAAVLGGTFSLDDLAALTGMHVEDCAQRADRALKAGLLVTRGKGFHFANDIVARVAYDSAPGPVQVSRHRRAAALLATRPEAAARQLVAAGDCAPAARAWLRAAHDAHLAFTNLEAERLLTEALWSAERSGDRRLLATVRLQRGQIRTDLGRHDAARHDHECALALARDLGDEELEAHALEQLGWTALYARDALTAVDLAARARHVAESAAAAPGALPSALLLLGRVRHWDGDYEQAASAYEQVLEARPEDTTKAVALAYRGALLQHTDRFAEARAVLERAALLCHRTGQFRTLLQSLFFCGLARGDVGDFAGALRALERARRLLDTYGVSYYRAGIDTTTSWLWQELGDVGRAREYAERAVDLAHRGGGALELEQELHALLALADCDLLAGRDDDAGARVETAGPLLDRPLPFRPRAAMRLLEMRARWDRTQAEALLEHARKFSSAKYESLALWHLGRPEQAAATAARTGSDLLVAQVGSPPSRRAAVERIAASLPSELRGRFVSGGRLPGLRFRAG